MRTQECQEQDMATVAHSYPRNWVRDQLSARNFYENAAGTGDIHTLKRVDR